MHLKILIMYFFGFTITLNGYGQVRKLDSLLVELNKYTNDDSLKAKFMLKIGEEFYKIAPRRILLLNNDLLSLSTKLNSDYYKHKCYMNQGGCYMFLFKVDSSILAFQNAKQRAVLLKSNSLIADANGFLGTTALMKGNTKQAIEILEETTKYYNEVKNYKKQAIFLYSLANAYNSSGEREKALTTILKVLKTKQEDSNPEIIAASYNLIGSLYGASGQFAEALQYHKEYATIQENRNNIQNTCIAYIAISADYLQLKKNDSAFYYANTALSIAQKNKFIALENKIILNLTSIKYDGFKNEERIKLLTTLKTYYETQGLLAELGNVLLRLGIAYNEVSDDFLLKNNINKEEKNKMVVTSFSEALSIAEKTNTYTLKEELLNNLSTYYEKEKNYIEAYKVYREYILMRDKQLDESKQLGIAKLTLQYAFEKKEDSLKLIQANTNGELQKQSFLNKVQQQSILLQNNELLLNKQTLFTNQQQFKLLNKDKELQQLAFLKTQADLQTEQLQKNEQTQKLDIVTKEKQLQSSSIKTLSQKNELNKLKQRQLLFYGIGAFATLLFLSLYFFNRNKAKQANLKLELEKKEIQFQRNLTDISMSALRSQMSPHFIFNCLNSIKAYTIANNTEAAVTYLTKFSKLIRIALENSRNKVVTLEKELESLELYMQMEAIRFKDKLSYDIFVHDDIDKENMEIPPMLLQPYIENAIWHGLMHKKDGGRIDVNLSLLHNEQILLVTIKDNGIGRAASEAQKNNIKSTHKSFGTKVTSERLDLINKVFKTGASVVIEDVIENNIVAGTIVTINIPFE